MLLRQPGGGSASGCTLVLEVDAADVRALLRQGARIVLARAKAGSVPNAVWLAFEPKPSTTVAWADAYGVYAGAVPERGGAPIRIIASREPAVARAAHAFLGQAFAPPAADSAIPRRRYEVRNAATVAVAFGLLQAATIDGTRVRAPLNVVVLPPGHTAEFANLGVAYAWVQAGIAGATTMVELPPAAVAVVQPGRGPMHRFRYDSTLSLFVPAVATLPLED